MGENDLSSTSVYSTNIGARTKIWQYTVVLAGAVIGSDCNICSHCFIENKVRIGNRVTVKNGVLIYDGATILDDVFLGPGVIFCNDKHPVSKNTNFNLQTIIINRGATIGAGSIIMPGVEIGEGAVVGAGTLVLTNILANQTYYNHRNSP